jgi:hypothetical protein
MESADFHRQVFPQFSGGFFFEFFEKFCKDFLDLVDFF